MYRVEINGAYSGHFNTVEEAMRCIAERARPYGHSWVIQDGFGRVYARG